MERLLELDKALLLDINGWNAPWADSVMNFFSAIPVWIPLYILIAACFFFPKLHGKRSLVHAQTAIPIWLLGVLGFAAIAACFGLTDHLSTVFKGIFERPRPCIEPSLEGLARFWTGGAMSYGFPSGHASNTFGLAILTSLIFRRLGYSIPIILWAAIVSYSRVYLAKHYPLDVLCGALLGIIIALAIYYLWRFSIVKFNAIYQKKKCSVS